MRKIWILLVVITLVSCIKDKEVIKIGVNNWPPCEVWYIAENQGFFGDVSVEIIRFSSWTDNMASLYKGNTDITHATYFNSIYYSDKGQEGVIIAPIDFVNGADGLVIKNSLSGIEALRGKTIGVEIGTDEHFLLSKALESVGLSISDLKLTSLPSYSSHHEFKNGEVDALFTYEPFLSIAAEEGNGKIMFTTNELPGYMVDVLIGNKNSITNRDNDYRKVMSAWYKAIDYIKENPNEAYKIMSQNEEMTVEEFKSFYESFDFYSQGDAINILNGDTIRDKLLEMFNFTQENDLTNQVLDIEKLLNSPLLEND